MRTRSTAKGPGRGRITQSMQRRPHDIGPPTGSMTAVGAVLLFCPQRLHRICHCRSHCLAAQGEQGNRHYNGTWQCE